MEYNLKKEILSWITPFAIAVVVALAVKFFVFDITPIENISMQPTLYANDRVFLDIASYKFVTPGRFDVVVFDSPIEKNTLYVKRVIGIPGDKIKISGGQIYIDDVQLKEDYLPKDTKTSGNIELTVPDGMVFVMGDNREHSDDSRMFGPITISSIKGHALFRIYPFDSIRGL